MYLRMITSVHRAKGLPGSGTTKLDLGAKKRLRRSRIEGYGPRPRPARDWPVPLSYHRLAFGRARELEPQAIAHVSNCAGQRALPVGTFSKSAILQRFRNFYTLRVETFRMSLCSRPPTTPINHERFRGNRSARF